MSVSVRAVDRDALLKLRSSRHAALGDPARLAIVDELTVSDRAPVELRTRLGMESNLLAHHLDVLEGVGFIDRTRSSGDGRRRYVHLICDALEGLAPERPVSAGRAVFICSANSARSQLAAAVWSRVTGRQAESAGTHPAPNVHPGAVAAARRVGLDLDSAIPQDLSGVEPLPSLVVTVCDRAHEELDCGDTWLHWSIPDPVPVATKAAFDATLTELRSRISRLVDAPRAAS